ATGTVQVTGSADPTAITAAVTAAGYPIVVDPIVVDSIVADSIVAVATEGSPPTGTTRPEGPPVDTFFSTDITDLPEATQPEALDLGDGEELLLRPGPVAKRLGEATVRMLGYNGSIPGPTLKVRQ